MHFLPKTSRARKIILSLLLIVALAILWLVSISIFDKPSAASLTGVLVLDDSDPDFQALRPADCVYVFPNGHMLRHITNLNICQTVGGARSLSAAANGEFFVTCENVANHITAFETKTARPLWRLDAGTHSAIVSRDGLVYALTSTGTIYGHETLVINTNGQIKARAKIGGFDLVLDEQRKVLWTVSSKIKKCDLDLNVLWEGNLIGWCAVSVDLNPDGSIWVAERQHRDVKRSQDRLLKISSDGALLKTVNLDFSPMCLRVNPADGTLWVTGGGYRDSRSGQMLRWIEKRIGHLPIGTGARDFLMRSHTWRRTDRRDPNGNLLQRFKESGHTIAIDPADNSVWIAGYGNLRHYSSDGAQRGHLTGLSESQSYVVVLPVAANAQHR
jgi:DNA-binding beta-propeller fold protein YncE